MSNNTTPPMPIHQLQRMLEGLSMHITSAHRNQPARKSLANLLTKFVNDVITPIVLHEQLHPSCNTPIQPSTDTEELKNIHNTLQALTKVVTGLQKKTPPQKNALRPTPHSQTLICQQSIFKAR
ncbi:hypothetical protein F5888DRAFT_1810398 [Russula emetica]|nr:hypothetical protein F5888DRAFT_1810398 [Russula emetica]